MRCVIVSESGARRAAVLKRGPPGQVAAEAFSALLLREWGLPVPDPYLVVDRAGGVAFASADMAYPNLKHRVGWNSLPDGPVRRAAEALACTLVARLRSTPLAVAADEAIGNVDRNLGNILWDGMHEAWIDHANSLGQHDPKLQDANKLCTMALMSGEVERISRSAIANSLALDSVAAARAQAALPIELSSHALAGFVEARVTNLAARILARFPQPADLLSAP